MPSTQPVGQRGHRRPRLDGHWLGSIAFTLVLVSLVAAAIGANWMVTLALAATSAMGFGFFYLVFPGGAHFGVTVANFLAIYACLFEFFREANFPAAPQSLVMVARAMPVLGFLAACFLRRRRISMLVRVRRVQELDHLPRLTRWFIGTLTIGAASFMLPRMAFDPWTEGVALIVAMSAITLFVALAVRDVILVMVDVAAVFEGVARRLDQLVMPMMAFVTFYSLLVVVFGCLYRIADLTTPLPQFTMHGQAARIGFVDGLYYSVATITTLGFGDIAPDSMLVRALTGVEVVSGVLMLLFGFSEIMRSAGPDARTRRTAHTEPPQSRHFADTGSPDEQE